MPETRSLAATLSHALRGTSGNVGAHALDAAARAALEQAQRPVVEAAEGTFGAVVGTVGEGSLVEPLRAMAERCVEGGVVALVVPRAREGLSGALGRVLAMGNRALNPPETTEVCAPILPAGLPEREVSHVAGPRGLCVVRGVVGTRLA